MVQDPQLPSDPLGFRDLSFFAARRWRLLLAGCLGMLALAALSWVQIPRREEPKVDMPSLWVSLAYPGASPEDVETSVVKPIEEILYGMERVEYVESAALPNLARFRMKFEEGVNVDVAAEKVRGKIQGKKPELPVEAKDPDIVQESTSLTPMMLVALAGFSQDAALAAEAKRCKAELGTIPGISGIDLRGDQKPAVRVQLDAVKLASHRLSVEQVARALQSANVRVPGGEFRLGSFATLLQVDQPFTDAGAIAAVPILASSDGQGGSRILRLGDLADITDGSLQPRQRFFHRGTPAVALEIRFRGEADAVATGKAVRARLGQLQPTLPRGVSLALVHDQPQWISRKVSSFAESLLEGMLLVMLVVTLGMGWRPALVVSTVIPLAAGGAVFGLYLLGFSLDMVTLVGLIVALGLLVDDAVVVTESVQLMRDKGLGALRAAVFGTARMFWANNGTTAVAIASFLPLFFMGGDMGQFIGGLPAGVILSLAISLLVAQLVTPWLSTLLLRRRTGAAEIPDGHGFDRNEDRAGNGEAERNPAMAWLRRIYSRGIPWVVARPGSVVAAGTLLLAGALALFPWIGVQFFPKSEKPFLFVKVELPKGTHLDATTRRVQEILPILQTDPAVQEVAAVAGGGFPPIIGDRANSGEAGNLGDIFVCLKEGANVEAAAARLRRQLAGTSGNRISVDELWYGPPLTHPVIVRIYGDEYGKLRGLAEEVKSCLRGIPGAVNIDDSLSDSVPLTRVRIDADLALRQGLTPAMIGQTLRSVHGEDKVTEFRRGEDLVQVVLEGRPEPSRPFGSLEDTPIANPAGQLVPLRESGQASIGYGYAQLQRRNGRRIVEVSADVQAGVLPSQVLGRLDPWLKARKWESGYGFVYAGEQEEIAKNFRNLGLAAAGAMLLIAVLLLLMFDDFLLAGIVVLLVPFSLIGALAGLALTGNHFGFMAFLGLIALIGVFVNHKIYFIGRMQELLRRGDDLGTAILHAGQDRLRPVVLTALTAVLGLVPLTLFGGPMWGAFGWVNIFGLLASIPLSLILLPAFVVLALRLRGRFSRAKEA